MGMDQKVTFAAERSPTWEEIAAFLSEWNFPVQMRMIDGELAFPDETPPPSWRELRVGTAHGMVTLRRDADAITLTIWGNADKAMFQDWNAVTWAVASVSSGQIMTEEGTQTAEEFARKAEMPEGMRE